MTTSNTLIPSVTENPFINLEDLIKKGVKNALYPSIKNDRQFAKLSEFNNTTPIAVEKHWILEEAQDGSLHRTDSYNYAIVVKEKPNEYTYSNSFITKIIDGALTQVSVADLNKFLAMGTTSLNLIKTEYNINNEVKIGYKTSWLQ